MESRLLDGIDDGLPVNDADLARLRRLARSDGPMSAMLQEIEATAGVPVAIMDIVGDDAQGPDGDGELRVSSVSRAVIEQNKTIILESVASVPQFANDPYLLENGVRAYVGVPLRAPDGRAIGALALLNHEPRSWSPPQLEALELHALKLMLEINGLQAA